MHGTPWLAAADAVAIGRTLEPLKLLFLEDPVAPDNLNGWRRVRDKVALPLAAGERLAALAVMRPFIDERLLDVLQPDTGRFGGLTQMRKLDGLAEARRLTLAPQSGSLDPVAEFAAVHLLATILNALMLERMEPDWGGRALATHPALECSHGHLTAPLSPGHGAQIDVDFVAAHPSQRNTALPPVAGTRAPTARRCTPAAPPTGSRHNGHGTRAGPPTGTAPTDP